jgi:glycosyltransferase involved in cell wall biosynthesis
MKPLFSIITVTYNSENTISRTIESLINQSFKDFDYIIVDGASTDKTLKIIERYKPAFGERITVISEPDKGIYDAMNKGIKLANGCIVGLLNSDDYYLNNTLEIIYNEYKKSDFETIVSGGLIFKYEKKEQYLSSNETRFSRCVKKYKNPVRHPATFVPKSIYDKIGLFNIDYKIAADEEFILRAYKKNVSFLLINKPLVTMLDGGISNKRNFDTQVLKDKIKLLSEYCTVRILRYYLLFEFFIIQLIKYFSPQITYYYRRIVK